jgi:2-polyprenyl-3-methyl-5-hydroxy-6-metoxy-1,4-benzoquinol methylase
LRRGALNRRISNVINKWYIAKIDRVKSALIDEGKINPNIQELHDYFDRVVQKYFDGNRPKSEYFEGVRCYNCGGKEVSTSFVVNRFKHVRCKRCGMIYVNPRLREEITHKLYHESPYNEMYKIKLIPAIDYRKHILGTRKYQQISQGFKKPGKVLDIGCGLGEVLSVFKENGWNCTGIEFNEFAARYARDQFHLKIINKSIYDFSTEEQYDLVMLWGVLEHFYNPKKILKKIHEILSDNGTLVIEVPSADSVLVRFYERTQYGVDRIIEGDRHIMLFSLRGFEEMLKRTGFNPVKILSNGLDISTLNRLELKNRLDLEQVNEFQDLLDISLQGDLLRGFFKKE